MRAQKFGLLLLALSAAVVTTGPAARADAFQNYPGSIPLKYERQAASDLVYQGKKLLPDEARALFESGQVKDLADLDPEADSVVWSNEFPKGDFHAQDEMGINPQSDEMEYVADTDVPVGRFGFIASKRLASGEMRSFQILLDTKAHDVLLRKTLLRKIGYKIPPTARMARLRLTFKGSFSKKEFVRSIQRTTFLDAKRWAIDGADTDDTSLTLQDVVVFEGVNDPFYNLSRGDMVASVIQGRRLFNSLLVPFALTDAPESVNVFPWDTGRIFNGQLMLTYDDSESFTTSYEDARWILRRILKLSRQDWADIVQSAEYPAEVAALLTEKLISRRDFLREKLGLLAESADLPIDAQISQGPRLVQGKLVGDQWDGYASHFAGQDPDSPLSAGELFGLFKSKALTNLIVNLVSQFNTRLIPSTDVASKVLDNQINAAAKQFAHFILTGEVKSVPFAVWAIPYWKGNLIASREVVAGNYLGAENMVQVADVIGASLDAGAMIGMNGLPAKISFAGKAGVGFVRTYTHLKPIKSIKAALKEPFRNMMVTWLKSAAANPIDQILKLESLRGTISDDELQDKMKPLLKEFQDKLGVGESLIVQTSIAPEVGFQVGYGVTQDIQAYLAFQEKLTSLSRLHIFRKDERTIQVYRDPALFSVSDLSFGLHARIQVMNLGWSWINGGAKTEFFSLNIDPDLSQNPGFFDNLQAVSAVLRKSNVETLRKVQKPWLIDHDFSEKDMHFDILWWRYLKADATDDIGITHPSGAKKEFIRRTIGKRSGDDFETLTLDVLNSLTAEYLNIGTDINIVSNNGGNPADTFKGKAVSRQTVLESQIDGNQLDLSTMRLGVEYRWKGWDISQKGAQKIIDDITRKYGAELFPAHALTDTRQIQFYSVNVSLALYQAAIESLMSQSDSQVTLLYTAYPAVPGLPQQILQSQRDQFAGYLEKIAKAKARGDAKEVANQLAKLVNHAESTLSFYGLVRAAGGVQNLFVNGTIQGFKAGDENGANDVYSNTLGQIGTFMPTGPLRQIESQIGISEGELFIYWLMNRM